MALGNIKIEMDSRPAIYKIPNKWTALRFSVEQGKEYHVSILGLFQIKNEDESDAYFVGEFMDGTCFYASPNDIRFLDRGDTK